MGEQPNFTSQLAMLVSAEASSAHRDAERLGIMIERLASALGFTIALAARGNPEAIDEMITAAEAHAHAEAVEKSALGRFMADIRNAQQ